MEKDGNCISYDKVIHAIVVESTRYYKENGAKKCLIQFQDGWGLVAQVPKEIFEILNHREEGTWVLTFGAKRYQKHETISHMEV